MSSELQIVKKEIENRSRFAGSLIFLASTPAAWYMSNLTFKDEKLYGIATGVATLVTFYLIDRLKDRYEKEIADKLKSDISSMGILTKLKKWEDAAARMISSYSIIVENERKPKYLTYTQYALVGVMYGEVGYVVQKYIELYNSSVPK